MKDKQSRFNSKAIHCQNNENKLEIQIRLKYRDSVKALSDGKFYSQTDNQFIQQINSITKGQQNVLFSLIENRKKEHLSDQDCDQIDYFARLHYKANVVNKTTDDDFQQIQEHNRCNCGCNRGKGQNLSLLANIHEISILGSGVVLLFMFKKTFSFILLSAVLIYAIFAIVTNLMGNSSASVKQCQDIYCQYRTKASSQNKLEPQTYSEIQLWIGVAFCTVWIFILRLIKYFGKSQNENIDKFLDSSSDYGVILDNLPYGEYEQNDLLSYFDLLYEKSIKLREKGLVQVNEQNSQSGTIDPIKNQRDHKSSNKFNMKSVQIIYNMEFSRALIQKIIGLALQIKSYFNIDQQNKDLILINNREIECYKELKKQICQTLQLMTDLRKKFFYDNNFRKNISTTVALVEFNHPKDKDIFLKYFGNQKVGLMKEIQEKIKSYFRKDSKTVMFRGNVLKIQRAPQPSDLIFTNCEKKFSISRILVIILLTFCIIMLSFALITILIYFQDRLSAIKKSEQINDSDGKDDTTITIINIVISIGLQIVNRFLWISLFYILDIQYNHTMTQKIISQMNKVLFATCLNIIALPIISNYVIRNNVYGSKGLAGMVFDYQISVLGVGLLMKLIDPGHFIKRILLNIRTFRNMIIRFLCDNNVNVEPKKGVPQINALYEGNYFNIAESYVYVMAATYQAAFFCQLQPSLLILVTFVVVGFYWVNKFKVLRTCKIPQITQILVFQTALSQAAFVPAVYGAGSIVLSYIESRYNPSMPINYLPPFLSVGIGLIGLFNPGNYLNKFVSYLMKNLILKQKKKGTNEAQSGSAQGILFNNKANCLNDVIAPNEPQILTRLDNYFRDSNSLSLIGFQHVLIGGSQGKFPPSTINELEKYCQNFICDQEDKKRIQKKVKEIIVQKIFQKQNPHPNLNLANLLKDTETQKVSVGEKRVSKVRLPRISQHQQNY